ncbi:MAG: transposase [Thiogranum sp.]
MPRRARMYIPGVPYHIVQRGNNREACFLEPKNYRFYLELWRETSLRYGVAVHAYCLMTNHVHFLATPQHPASISDTMKVVGSRYARYINHRYHRTGTLWEGRHRASMIQSERYLLTCYRYIELNPVRAGIVKHPKEYRWSSYGANARGDHSWLTAHQEYVRLGETPDERYQTYRNLFISHVCDRDLHLIRRAAHYCQPVADKQYRRQIENKYGLRLGYMQRGRPKQEEDIAD